MSRLDLEATKLSRPDVKVVNLQPSTSFWFWQNHHKFKPNLSKASRRPKVGLWINTCLNYIISKTIQQSVEDVPQLHSLHSINRETTPFFSILFPGTSYLGGGGSVRGSRGKRKGRGETSFFDLFWLLVVIDECLLVYERFKKVFWFDCLFWSLLYPKQKTFKRINHPQDHSRVWNQKSPRNVGDALISARWPLRGMRAL